KQEEPLCKPCGKICAGTWWLRIMGLLKPGATMEHAFLLRPLPYPEPERLVMVGSQERGNPIGVSFLDYQDWREQNTVFEDLAFFNLRWNANVEFSGETETLSLTFGASNLFSLLRAQPLIGRNVTPEDSRPGAKDTVLISHHLWQRRFGAEPGIIGRELRVEG